MAFTTYQDVDSLINDIYSAALVVARENARMSALVQNFGDQTGMTPRKVTQYGTSTFNALGEADDMIPAQFSRTLLSTLTPTEYGDAFLLTDQRVESDPENVRRDAAFELGMGMAQKIDIDIASHFDELTGGTIVSAGGTITWGNIFSAISILEASQAPRPYVAVLDPFQWNRLAQAVIPAGAQTNAPGIQDEVVRRYVLMQVGGVDLITSSNVQGHGGTAAYGAVFSQSALALDMRRAPRLEPQRDASRRAWELNMTAVYAAGVWRPAYGVAIVADASVPTA